MNKTPYIALTNIIITAIIVISVAEPLYDGDLNLPTRPRTPQINIGSAKIIRRFADAYSITSDVPLDVNSDERYHNIDAAIMT